MKSIAIVSIVAIVAFITYQLGVLESPPFLYQESFLGGHELLAIVVTTQDHDIGKHVMGLIKASRQALNALEDHETMLKAAAKLYKVKDITSSVGVGLYFDDPSSTEHPRWAVGWAVEGPSFKTLRAKIPKMAEASGLSTDTNPIRVIRIGGKGTQIVTARIPWRNMLTPMIAPVLHWRRGFRSYQEYTKNTPVLNEESSPIALEVFVAGENKAYEFIDYAVLFGSVGNTWEDTFPGSTTSSKNEPADAKVAATE